MTKIHLCMLAAMLALTGCAAHGPMFADQEAGGPKLGADKGRVYFYRNKGELGAGVQPALQFDGAVVGKSQPGGYFYVDTTPGSHEAMASTEVERKLSFTVDKGEVKYVRTSVSMGLFVGHVVPQLVSATEAQPQLALLRYTGGQDVK